MADGKMLEQDILSTFSELASTLGYSPIHGKIIGALLLEGEPLSLQELARKTGYSTSMISLSLDLLEVLSVIKKFRKPGDRQLYVQLEGDLLEILKKAVIIKVQKGIGDSLRDLSGKRKALRAGSPESAKAGRAIAKLEGEIKRLEKYIGLLNGIRLP
jgi:DNA-binding transcriptional regulator GbsR (MarR family)